ncbi:MAG: septation regulator SpoVG [bacterium]
MEITEVKVYPANEGKLKAYATMVFDGCFIVRDMKIIKSDKGLFVSMPSRRKKDGSFKDIVHPLNADTRKMIEERIIEEYKKTANDPDAVIASDGGASHNDAASHDEGE